MIFTIGWKEAIMILTPVLLFWVRTEVRFGKLETSVEDVKRLVLNGHGKKPTRRKT